MSQDSRVFFRIFFGIGLVLILISVVIFYKHSAIGWNVANEVIDYLICDKSSLYELWWNIAKLQCVWIFNLNKFAHYYNLIFL